MVAAESPNGGIWLASEVRATPRLRPNYTQQQKSMSASRIFVCCTFRCGRTGWRCRTAGFDPQETFGLLADDR